MCNKYKRVNQYMCEESLARNIFVVETETWSTRTDISVF